LGREGFSRSHRPAKTKWYLGFEIDFRKLKSPSTCGSTEELIAGHDGHGRSGRGSESVFEPFYENYAPDAHSLGRAPRYVPLRAAGLGFRTATEAARGFQRKDQKQSSSCQSQ